MFVLQVGDVGERPLGPRMADAAGEEAPLHAASRQLQALPDNGDQPQGNKTFLTFHNLENEAADEFSLLEFTLFHSSNSQYRVFPTRSQ